VFLQAVYGMASDNASVIGAGWLGFIYSMCEPTECPESINQQESSDGAECNDHDGLSLRLRHLNPPTTTNGKTQKIERLPHVAERHRAGRVLGFHSLTAARWSIALLELARPPDPSRLAE
jgi:hypothetical protein